MLALEEAMARVADLAREHTAYLNETQRETIDSLAYNAEPGIALELLCTALDEHDWPVTRSAFQEIREVGRLMGIAPIELADWDAELKTREVLEQ